MVFTLKGFFFPQAAFETPDNTDEVLGVLTGDEDAELEVEDAIFSL
jgi:hypothetical protein